MTESDPYIESFIFTRCLSIGSALAGIAGIAVLFGVLQIGKENKGWTQLD